jgi:hypothetical protein
MTTNVVGRLTRVDDDEATPVGIDISVGTVVVVAAACGAAFLPTADLAARRDQGAAPWLTSCTSS